MAGVSLHLRNKPLVWTLDRQTTLPPGRGVCLIFSSCPGPLTTMTGSELAGHRLLGSARRAVLRHRAPRTEGWPCATPQTTPTARRSAPPPAPSGGGQSLAIDPAGGIGKYPSGLCMGIRGPLHYRANVEIAVTSRGPAERGEGSRDTGHQMKRG